MLRTQRPFIVRVCTDQSSSPVADILKLRLLYIGRDGQNARLQRRDDDGVAPGLRPRILSAPGNATLTHEVNNRGRRLDNKLMGFTPESAEGFDVEPWLPWNYLALRGREG